jgi:hypothetical protein
LKFWGAYKLTVGVLAGAESFMGMLKSADPQETSVWGALTIAGAVLLLVDGLEELLAAANRWTTVGIAAAIPIAISILSGDRPARLWIFAVVVGFVEWVFQELKRTTGRTEIGALACCVALCTSLANTTFMLFRMYWNQPQFWPLGQIFSFMSPIALPWTLVLILLAHAVRECRSEGQPASDRVALAAEAVDQ